MYETQNCLNETTESSVACSAYCSKIYYDMVGTVTFLRKSFTRMNCAFGIIQEPGSYLKIKEVKLMMPCGTAFLEMRDGPHEDSPLMGRFCDEKGYVPNNFKSSQNHVVIRWDKA